MPTYWTSGSILLREFLFEAEIVNLAPLRVEAGQGAPLGSIIKITKEGLEVLYAAAFQDLAFVILHE